MAHERGRLGGQARRDRNQRLGVEEFVITEGVIHHTDDSRKSVADGDIGHGGDDRIIDDDPLGIEVARGTVEIDAPTVTPRGSGRAAVSQYGNLAESSIRADRHRVVHLNKHAFQALVEVDAVAGRFETSEVVVLDDGRWWHTSTGAYDGRRRESVAGAQNLDDRIDQFGNRQGVGEPVFFDIAVDPHRCPDRHRGWRSRTGEDEDPFRRGKIAVSRRRSLDVDPVARASRDNTGGLHWLVDVGRCVAAALNFRNGQAQGSDGHIDCSGGVVSLAESGGTGERGRKPRAIKIVPNPVGGGIGVVAVGNARRAAGSEAAAGERRAQNEGGVGPVA